MKFLTRLFFLFVFLLLTVQVIAQGNYIPGYVVTNNNDTIIGQIKDRRHPPFAHIYKKIRFKSDLTSRKKYAPSQIAGYKQGDNLYESVWVDVTSDFLQTRYLSIPQEGNKHFMKVIVKGFLTYYQWQSLDQESGATQEIDLYKRENDGYYIRVTQGILGLREKALKEYFGNCPELVSKIVNKQLRKPIDIARFYNHWLKEKGIESIK